MRGGVAGGMCGEVDHPTPPRPLQDHLPSDATIFHFREGVLELVRDLVFIVGSLNTFRSMYQRLCGEGLPWTTMEACLFVMCAVAPSLRP